MLFRSVASAAELACSPPAQQLIINEIMIDPDIVTDPFAEWVEIYNPTGDEVDLFNWYLKDQTQPSPQTHRIATSLIVPSDGYVVLCRNNELDGNGQLYNKGVPCDYMYANFTLVNTVDAVVLADPDGNDVDTVAFSGAAAPTGYSMQLRNPYLAHDTVTFPATPNDPEAWAGLSWGIAAHVFDTVGNNGTPGAKNVGVWQNVPAAECNDAQLCSLDYCQAELCHYTPIPNCCNVNTDCNDNQPCTLDSCDTGTHQCVFTPKASCCTTNAECVDDNPCNTDYCISNTCRHSKYNEQPLCCFAPAVANPVTGVPWNSPEEAALFADGMCDDKNVCTADHCDLVTNRCYADPPRENCCTLPDQCEDNNPCTFNMCVNYACVFPRTNSTCCTQDSECDDGNPCTDDSCVTLLNSCRHIQNERCCYSDNDCKVTADDNNPCTDEICMIDSGSGLWVCGHRYDQYCAVNVPYVQDFENIVGLAEIGWTIKDTPGYSSTTSPNHWYVTTQGQLGHTDDPADPLDGPDEQSFLFSYAPTTLMVQAKAMTPFLNATKADPSLGVNGDKYNKTKNTTLQWRMAYRHSQPGGTVTLKVLASADNFNSSEVVAEWIDLDQDIPYTLFSRQLSANLNFAPNLKIGFLIDTATTFNMESLEIDDVKVAAGLPNTYLKSMIKLCPDTGDCTPTNSTLVVQSTAEQSPEIPTITSTVNQKYRLYLCMVDPDAFYSTWNESGNPAAFLDGAPMDAPAFIKASSGVGQAFACENNASIVQAVCGTPASSTTGYFFCGVDLAPEGNVDFAGTYQSALVVRDEYDPTGLLTFHSPLETQIKWKTNVILDDGYIVWSPLGRDEPEAVLVKDAIKNNDRHVQIVTDLGLIPDLSRYDGVFALLGVYGKHYAINAAEAARLKVFLDGGGRVYIEGGDYFFKQTVYDLDDYFKITATSDGVAKLDGPMTGRNFLDGYDFGYSQEASLNFFNDRLVHTPELGGREIFRNAGARVFATTVSYEGIAAGGVLPYRTIGSSILFGGLVPQGGGKTATQLMGKYIAFLENGYPNCTGVIQCEDDEVCTDDSCGGDLRCVNAPREGCIPCKDDEVRLDGSPSCPVNQACKVSVGYCVDIPFQDRFDTPALGCSKFFGSGPVTAQCAISVTTPAALDDIQVKAKVTHAYRGDIKLSLITPSGTSLPLKAANPADGEDNVYATYDVGVAPDGNPAILDTVNGQHMEGTWTLVAEDMDPGIYNGLMENWRLFTTHHVLGCADVSACPVDPCASVECVDTNGDGENECHYIPMDCDDGKDCTIDYCDPATQMCVHDPITGSGCACESHDDCPDSEACLNLGLTAACDPIGDKDPVTGLMHCLCSPIEGTPYTLDLPAPVAIPDSDATGITRTLDVSAPGYVNRLKVRLRLSHPAVGDIRATLCHEGVCVTLRNLTGGVAPGFHDVYDYNPVNGPGEITDFRSLPLAGEWTLTVTDNIFTEVGDLLGMVLYIVPADCFQTADCDDGNLCTVDTCQNPSEGGTCMHTAKVCEPTDDPCQANVCEPTTGVCGLQNQPNGTPCEDGLYCTVDDACSAGVCTAGEGRDCSMLNGNCIVGSCNEDLKQCQPLPAPDGTACDDGELCTGGDACLAGLCQPGATMVCPCPHGTDEECSDDGNKCNGVVWHCNDQKLCELMDGPVVCPAATEPCRTNVCDPWDGVCKSQYEMNYMPCEDGNFCTVADYCQLGSCLEGFARDCSSLDEDCKTGVCDEYVDSCVASNMVDGTVCEREGLGCTIDECLGGTCSFNRMVDCSLVKDDCNDGVCQDVGWGGYVCVRGPLPDGTVCTDEPNPCTSDKCASGLCEHTLLTNCNGPCNGDHPFDAGDDMCGKEDSCVDGIRIDNDGNGQPDTIGSCTPTCIAPNCVRTASPLLDLPIDERLTCTTTDLTITTGYNFVEAVEAKVRLTHGYLGDLTIDIRDPQGYEHRVWNHIGDANQGFANTFDLSFPVPYPGIPTSGVPMCALAGEQANGTWSLKICDTGAGNGGVLHDWKLYVRGSSDPELNMGHRCEDAIDLGSHPVVPTVIVDGTTLCSLNSVHEVNACGGVNGLDRLYMFTLTKPRRVTIKLNQPDRDLILYLKGESGGTCAPGKIECAQNFPAGSQPEVIDRQLGPACTDVGGVEMCEPPIRYYVGVDTEGGPYDYGPFRFEIRIKDLLPDGSACVVTDDPLNLGPQDLDCASVHCQNGYCCDHGDCCPADPWAVPPDGDDPRVVKTTAEWLSSDSVCPAAFKDVPVCNDARVTGEPPVLINDCQGQRYDANCVDHMCVKTRVDDDSACDEFVHSDPCGLWNPIFCGEDGPFPPFAQIKPTCPTWCMQDEECDVIAHCDPAPPLPADSDDTPLDHNMVCLQDLVNGSVCNEDSDCESGHCQNGYCCDSGDCCPTDDVTGAKKCPAAYTTDPWCQDTSTCEGQRIDPVCVDNICGTVLVHDDCACNGSLSDNCGFFIPVFCGPAPSGTCPATDVGGYTLQPDETLLAFHNGDPQCLTSCVVGGVETDTVCDDGFCDVDGCVGVATCDPCTQDLVDRGLCTPAQMAAGDSVCQGAYPNGYPCNEAGDCENKMRLPPDGPDGGHCQNGFCCDFGDCCALPADCPAGTRMDPVCDYWTTCQGHRRDSTCPTETYSCGTLVVEDDTACVYDLGHVSDECGYYLPIYCDGTLTQVNPDDPVPTDPDIRCPTTCLEGTVEVDEECDLNAHCDPDIELPNQANSICQEDLPNDEVCDEPSDCVSGFCQIHFCCDPDGCCAGCKVDSAVLAIANGGTGSPRTDVLPLIEDISPTAGPDGTPVHVQTIWGQQSPVDRLETAGMRIVDTGFLAGSTVPVFCYDLARDVTETDVDCGGGLCKKCEAGKECAVGTRDCISGVCDHGRCL